MRSKAFNPATSQWENIDSVFADNIDYSTTEQFTGKHWIDGKKIYQKTYYAEISTDSATIPLGITYDKIVGINGVAKLDGGRYVFIQSINPDTYDGTYMEIQGNFLSITILSAYAEATITLQYTKKGDD